MLTPKTQIQTGHVKAVNTTITEDSQTLADKTFSIPVGVPAPVAITVSPPGENVPVDVAVAVARPGEKAGPPAAAGDGVGVRALRGRGRRLMGR